MVVQRDYGLGGCFCGGGGFLGGLGRGGVWVFWLVGFCFVLGFFEGFIFQTA